MLVMARPTKSKVLYVQMKGRDTRKCEETSKEVEGSAPLRLDTFGDF